MLLVKGSATGHCVVEEEGGKGGEAVAPWLLAAAAASLKKTASQKALRLGKRGY